MNELRLEGITIANHVDSDGEVMVDVFSERIWLTKDEATLVVDHLKKLFELKGE